MGLLDFKDDYQTRFRRLAGATRDAVLPNVGLRTSIASLAEWVSTLPGTVWNAEEPSEAFKAWITDPTHGTPVRWCTERDLPLDAALANELTAMTESKRTEALSQTSGFVIGAALMMAAIKNPSNSRGLTVPLRMTEHLDPSDMTWAGAVYYLKSVADRLPLQVLAEIDAEVARWRANPLEEARMLDPRYIEADIKSWSSAVGLEQSLGSSAAAGMLHTDLATVLMTIASRSPRLVAARLDELGHPTVAQAILGDRYGTDDDVLVSLLKEAPSTVDSDGHWNRRFAARLVIEEIENRCSLLLQEESRLKRLNGAPPLSADEIAAFTGQVASLVLPALLQRPDAAFLTAEWVAHLAYVHIARFNQPVAKNNADVETQVAVNLVNRVAKASKEYAWAKAPSLWLLFSGDPAVVLVGDANVQPTEDKKLLRTVHPAWVDGRGRRDRISPILVATAFASERQDERQDYLARWVETVMAGLQGEPYLFQFGRQQNPIVASYLAWPIGNTREPTKRVIAIWSRLTEARYRAKSQAVRETTEYVDCCIAAANVAVAVMLQYQPSTDEERSQLAIAVADIVDEIRYSVPSLGIEGWGLLTSRMAATMVQSGLLAQRKSLEGLLERYRGDDEGMVSVLVNLVGGMDDRTDIMAVVAKLAIDVPRVVARWLEWNAQRAANLKSVLGDRAVVSGYQLDVQALPDKLK